ncbi:ABC transporter permease subunit [Tenggerimyces flavus]|uniref:ABC transporter permease subunit n=1 Tax=Tenggerimyces flavus TaxID=1708749 RepID=A0ABV7Y509_9ACTN|nr:ABC transporter permease subunit [Tenggerimyces flavus]MBM7788312.1 ABC-type Na+ efflux pump permease subunit [Tenggerimyces flavus]
MNWRAIRAIVRRDLAVVARSKAVIVPMIVMPVLFVLVMPVLAGLIAQLELPPRDLADLLRTVPQEIVRDLPEESGPRLAGLVLGSLLPPLTLVVPLIVAQVIATDAVAGERERGTLEGLLLAPVSDRDLLVAKLLVALIPAYVVLFGGTLVYAIVTDVMLWSAIGGPFLPTVNWLLLVLWLGPSLAGAALALSLVISARTRTIQGAQQIAGVSVLPLVFIIVGQFSGLVFLNRLLVIVVGVVLWCLAVLFVWIGSRSLARERLGSRL